MRDHPIRSETSPLNLQAYRPAYDPARTLLGPFSDPPRTLPGPSMQAYLSYDPAAAATWGAGDDIPFAFLANALRL